MIENNSGATNVTPKEDNTYFGVAVDNVKVTDSKEIITGEPSIVVGTNEPAVYERVEGGGTIQVGPSPELTISLEENGPEDNEFLNNNEKIEEVDDGR